MVRIYAKLIQVESYLTPAARLEIDHLSFRCDFDRGKAVHLGSHEVFTGMSKNYNRIVGPRIRLKANTCLILDLLMDLNRTLILIRLDLETLGLGARIESKYDGIHQAVTSFLATYPSPWVHGCTQGAADSRRIPRLLSEIATVLAQVREDGDAMGLPRDLQYEGIRLEVFKLQK